MANYQDIKGFNIQSKSSDPVPYAQELADNPWGGVWASGGSLNTARKDAGGFGAGATNGIVAGGYGGGGAAAGNYVESYNGTSWTETTELNAGRGWSPAGAGTQTAGFVAGGQPLPPASGYTGITEKWDGSSWTESGDLNIARSAMNAAGTQTAGVGFGGINPGSPAAPTDTEKFNGTAWTEANSMNTARSANSLASRGSPQSSVICVFNAYTEVYNGTNWTETTEVNTSRTNGGGAGESSTSAVIYGGSPGQNIAKTESWDGTSWTEVNDLATGRSDGGTTGGTSQNALYAAGETATAYVANTEEWAFSGLPPSTPAADYSDSIVGDMYYNSTSGQFKAIKSGGTSIGTWSSGGTFSANVSNVGGAGTQTAAVSIGGFFNPGPPTNLKDDVYLYNGVSWSTNPNSYPVVIYAMGSAGTQTAGLFAGGITPAPPNTNTDLANKFNGTSFSSASTLTSARRFLAAAGTQTAGKATGGYTTTQVAIVEDYNGTSWTETTDMSNPRQQHSQLGSSTAALVVGKSPASNIVESWNGSSWTAVNTLNTGRQSTGASGTNTYGIVYAGENSGGTPQATTESWDGTSWTEVGDLANARYSVGTLGYSAPADKAVTWAGNASATATEEWNAADFQIKTVTTS